MTIDKAQNGFIVHYNRNKYVFVKWSDVVKFITENEIIEKNEDYSW